MGPAIAAAALLWAYAGTLASYLRDQYYQEHFLYLWVFFGLALTRSLRPPFRWRFALDHPRDLTGLGLVLAGWLLSAGSELAGSSSGARTSLVLFLTGCCVLVVPAWTVRRCIMHGLLMQLCFGLPYSVYYPLTAKLQWGVASWIELPARWGWVDYVVESSVVHFPHYQLAITPDCSGLGQLLTFVGIAALGVLSSARNRRRTIFLVLFAVLLAWLSNLARVGFFVFLVAFGCTWAVDDATWHALLGFLVFLPFVSLLIGVILRTHAPLTAGTAVAASSGRVPVALLVVPCLLVHLWLARPDAAAFPAPQYFAEIEHPPGHQLELRGHTEAADRLAYVTPWLVNARFRDAEGRSFDLFHYVTRSNSHLCVHKVAACLQTPEARVRYEPPVQVDGRSWWRIAFDVDPPGLSSHAYFAFEVAGKRYDDSWATQLTVFWQRLLGGSWEVRLTRVVRPGPLPAAPDEYEAAVLTWLGRLSGSQG